MADRIGRWRRADADLAAAVADLTAAERVAVPAKAGHPG
jgi:hypothetical protein